MNTPKSLCNYNSGIRQNPNPKSFVDNLKFEIAPLISAIIGALLVNYYEGYFIAFVYIIIYILSYLKQYKFSLILFVLYLLSIGFFIKINEFYDFWNIISFIVIVIPNIIFLDKLLNPKYNSLKLVISNNIPKQADRLFSKNNSKNINLDGLFGVLYILSYINIYFFIFLALCHLAIIIYNKAYSKSVFLILISILPLIYAIMTLYKEILQYSYLLQILVLIGFSMLYIFGIWVTQKTINTLE
ncbi:hypothetical protein [Methanococcus aeolicus]|uniref:Uncharacterized protein n=1 Tax=Methanococcus aeolicus (strain ATCC BAA-1280 / DSM 17508 / OCM 812 / Nankai-3) TaxID=419665 RepID=A6UU20_META3|nr:hypothetical protein [Methanococcus aeolicus]ABR55992.1 hypothetical protein Maeo_0406 [Methanococcus aeolicus Nankai-3]UXM85409.1 hypothetical protein N6C89_03790 [Methanococcus aeolicus]